MLTALLWWAAVSLIGLLALPLTFFTLRHLPDRGYAASRLLGILVVSYVAWLANYQVGATTAAAAGILVLLGLSGYFGRGLWTAHLRFLKDRIPYVAAVEVLFLGGLLAATSYKAATGAIFESEKPADFTLLHSLMTTERMPPHDPWLAGAPISYYYFGYFIVGLLARLTGTVPGVAFNMGMALVWALTGLMAFGLGYALTSRKRYGLLLAFSLTLMGNLDYWFRAAHVFHYGDLREKYIGMPDNAESPNGVQGVLEYLRSPLSHFWEYWHASRVIDVTEKERLITEFPAFSFFLGDLHPHVMSLPFFLLTLATSLSLLKAPLRRWGAFGSRVPWQVLQVLVLSIVYGSLGFLNSWDFPTVMLVLAVCLGLREMWLAGGLSLRWFLALAQVGLPIAILSFGLYMPFYRSLTTQLQGVRVPKDPTDLYYWPVIFGGFLVVLVPALVLRARGAAARAPVAVPKAAPAPAAPVSEKDRRKKDRRKVARKAEPSRPAGLPVKPYCTLCLSPGTGAPVCPKCGGDVLDPHRSAALPDSFLKRVLARLGVWLSGGVRPWGWVLAAALVGLAAFDHLSPYDPGIRVFSLLLALLALAAVAARSDSFELAFAAIAAAIGFLIAFAVEWFYFKDLFSMFEHLVRMNTVFKFFIHVWLLLATAAVPLLAWLMRAAWPRWSMPARVAWASLAGMVTLAGVSYPALAIKTRLQAATYDPANDLDGTEHFRTHRADEARAAEWVKSNAPLVDGKPPVFLEAWEGSFTPNGRMATFTGYATVLGWEGHEEQWRGGPERVVLGGLDETDTVRRRYEDVNTMYDTPDLNHTRELLRRYRVRFVVVGDLERKKYPGAPFDKWAALGPKVYGEERIAIYDVGGS